MNAVLHLGPLALPWSVLLDLGSALLALQLGGWLARRRGLDTVQLQLADRALWAGLLLALLLSRAAFVSAYPAGYLAAPLAVLDIRDGGWDSQTGLIGTWMAALLWLRRHPALRRPLLGALGAGSVLWIAGQLVLLAVPRAEQPLPALVLQRLDDGQPVALQAYRGRPVVLNLWASWCGPCRREMPVLAAAQQRLGAAAHIVFVNQGERADTVRAYLGRERLALREVLLDPRGEAGAGQARALPTTLFYDAGGRLVDVRIGELSQATLAQRLQALGIAPGAWLP